MNVSNQAGTPRWRPAGARSIPWHPGEFLRFVPATSALAVASKRGRREPDFAPQLLNGKAGRGAAPAFRLLHPALRDGLEPVVSTGKPSGRDVTEAGMGEPFLQTALSFG